MFRLKMKLQTYQNMAVHLNWKTGKEVRGRFRRAAKIHNSGCKKNGIAEAKCEKQE